MNKGFVAIMVTAAFFVAVMLMLSFSSQVPTHASVKENFSREALLVTNYELNLNQVAKDCNWSLGASQIKSCVDGNSNILLGPIISNVEIVPSYTTCLSNSQVIGNTIAYDLNCTTQINNSSGTVFYNNFGKRVLVKQ